METLLQDIRFTLRTLRRRPGFTTVAIVTLALGIGANVALFSVVRSVLMRPLPYEDPARVMTLWSSWVGWDKTWISQPEILDYQNGATTLESVGAYTITTANLTGDGEPEQVTAGVASAEMFEVLGSEPLVGRVFTEEEDVPGRDDVVLLSQALWERRFGGDPAIVGRTIDYNGAPRTVLGVMPEEFSLPEDYRNQNRSELWVPLAIDVTAPSGRGSHYLFGAARLADGSTLEQAQAELDRLTAGWVDQGLVPAEANFRALLIPAEEEVLGNVRPTLLLLFGAVGLVLLIACANVANLLVAASDARRREMAVRAAIGAGRQRIVSQLLTESVVLSVVGGVLGVGLAAAATEVLVRVQPGNIPRLGEASLDLPVLGFALLITLASGIFFGIGPSVLFSRLPLAHGLTDGGRGGTAGPARNLFRRALIVVEVALSMVLVIAAGLMIRSVLELYRIDLGVEQDRVLTMRMALPVATYPEPEDVTRFFADLETRVAELPGVREVGSTRLLPLTGTIGDWSIVVEGQEADGSVPADWQVVTPGYVEAMGMRLVRGRTIEPTDRIDSPPVAMINETMAASYWPGDDPIGRRFQMGGPEGPRFTVVGILAPVRHNTVVEEERNEMYLPHEQFTLVTANPPRAMTLVTATEGNPLGLVGSIREQVRAMDPDVPIADIRPLAEVTSVALAQPRFAMLLLTALAVLALTLAAIGIYGVISYSVAERRREMGIRMALGAEAQRLLRMVLIEGLRLTFVGVIAGLVASFLLTRLMTAMVYGVGTLDPITFVAVPAILTGVALVAAWIPGRRATRVDPVVALRAD